MTTLATLTTAQIAAALDHAGLRGTAARLGDTYNQIRRGDISGAVGTLKAGCSPRAHQDARRRLRQALRALVSPTSSV